MPGIRDRALLGRTSSGMSARGALPPRGTTSPPSTCPPAIRRAEAGLGAAGDRDPAEPGDRLKAERCDHEGPVGSALVIGAGDARTIRSAGHAERTGIDDCAARC